MKYLLTPFLAFSFAGSLHAATVFATEGFESGLGSVWSASGPSPTGLYVHQTTLQPTDDTTTNFASGGTQAFSLAKAGGTMTSSTFDLSGGGASETLTFDTNFVWHNGSTTRRAFVELSLDGGTNWFGLANIQVGGAVVNKSSSLGTVTITEGVSGVNLTGGNFLSTNFVSPTYNGTSFTNNMVLRVRNTASAGADARLFIDNVSVASSVNIVPEPSAALFGSIGALALLRRRRA